ncbi:MAG: hypothetical protein HKN77_06800, partial [Woeseiaceae bacterium]|nr:hypothetical protein [Woeseiaceae bacterium]
LVAPSVVSVGTLQVSPDSSWNRAPAILSPYMHKGAEIWTHDGILLDRVMIIPAIADGQAIFVDKQGQAALPEFRASMLPNELQEMTESSLAKYFGEGESTVSGKNLRPHRFGDQPGLLFDIEAAVADGPDYKGLVGAFVNDNKLYLMVYVAADPYYFEKYLADASALITGARIAIVAPAS